MENENNLIETELLVDQSISMHLKETAAWGKFLGIAGFVYSVLISIIGIFAATKLSRLDGYSGNGPGAFVGGFVGVFYVLIAVVVFFMSMFLFRFSQKAQTALQQTDQASLTDAFKNLKIYFRFAGITMAVALVISALGIIGIMVTSIFRG